MSGEKLDPRGGGMLAAYVNRVKAWENGGVMRGEGEFIPQKTAFAGAARL